MRITRKYPLRAACVLLAASSFRLSAAAADHVKIPAKVCDVTAYGANGERQQILLNTEPFQKAIDDCAAAGGGTVRVPAGNYLVAPLQLRSNVRLQLEKNATIVASTVESTYRATAETKFAEAENGWLPFISVANAENVAISGEGTIDGQGAVWWERYRANVRETPARRASTDRPRLIYVKNSRNVLIEGVSLVNSPSFHVVLRYSEDVDVTRTRIATPWHAPNTDAIDPIDSRRVRITWNDIDCNDDHVAVKAEKADPKYPDGVTSDIYIAHNTLHQGRGISIGSESSGGVNNVLVEHNSFIGSMYGLRIKSPRGKAGKVTNVTYRDTKMVDVGVPLVISGYYKGAPNDQAELDRALAEGGFVVGDQLYPADSDPAQDFNPVKTPQFSNVTVKNLVSTGKSKAIGYVVGVPEATIKSLRFENVKVEADRGLLVRNAELTLKDSKLKARQGESFILQKNATLQR